MRPLHLTVEGFASFRDPAEVDFDGADYFAFVGPTGSGKSSLIDAIVFALYGSVPRYDDRRLVAPVISQGKVEARVGLDFALGPSRYRAVRVVRATGRGKGATTKEARLERLGPDGSPVEVLAGDAEGLTTEVTHLLGLSFDHFTKCVVLPQGAFARFLHDKPAARQDLLVELLGLGIYGQVGQRANQEAAAAASRAALADEQLARPPLADASADAVAAAEQRLAELDRLRELLTADEATLAALAQRQADAEAEAHLARGRAEALLAVRMPEQVQELAADLQAADCALARAKAAEHEAESAAATAETELSALPARASLEAASRDHAEREEKLARLDKGRRVLAEVEAAEGAAQCEVATCEAATAAVREARQEAAHLHQATVLRRVLVAGRPCPVCEQPVHAVPPCGPAPDLDEAESAVAAAERELAAATDFARDAGLGRARAEATLAGLVEQLSDLDARLAEHPDPCALAASLEMVSAAEAALAGARARRDAASVARRRAAEQQERLVSSVAGAWRGFDRARDAVAVLGPPPVDRGDLARAWNELVGWAVDRAPVESAAADRAARTAAEAEAERAERLAVLLGACADAGVVAGASIAEAVTEARAAAAASLEQQRAAVAEAERLRTIIAASTEDGRVARALAQHLRSTGFEQWLLDEVLEQLVQGATLLLRELSGNGYSLTLDGAGGFAVVDHHNADAVRSARTLSGGETFLASLALALALADRLAGFAVDGAAPLEAIFLDEGFGSLDPDTLDTVAAAIENLAAAGRVVGLVTHVRELAERVPTQFEVDKGPTTSTVRRVDG